MNEEQKLQWPKLRRLGLHFQMDVGICIVVEKKAQTLSGLRQVTIKSPKFAESIGETHLLFFFFLK